MLITGLWPGKKKATKKDVYKRQVRMVAFINKEDMNDVPDRVYKYGTY